MEENLDSGRVRVRDVERVGDYLGRYIKDAIRFSRPSLRLDYSCYLIVVFQVMSVRPDFEPSRELPGRSEHCQSIRDCTWFSFAGEDPRGGQRDLRNIPENACKELCSTPIY